MTLTSINSLRTTAMTPAPNDLCQVLGYYASGDGGGGDFYWDAVETAADNSGTIIKPNSVLATAPGRWKRIFDGTLNVKWFGAKGNRTDDDIVAINSCITFAKTLFTTGGKLIFPRGDYKISATIDISQVSSWQIIGEGAWLYPSAAITAVVVEGGRFYYRGLNVSYYLLPYTQVNENCVAIWLHKNGTTVNNQVNNSIFESFSIVGAHTGIKSVPDTGLVWQLDFKSVYFDIYEGVSTTKAIAFDIASGFNQGGSTTIRIHKCPVMSFYPGNRSFPRGVGYRGFRLYYSTDVYITDSSYDGYLDTSIELNQNGQIMDIFSKNIHIDGFHCESLINKLNANSEVAPFKINSTGFIDIKNVVMLTTQMNCGGPTAAGAWFLCYGSGIINFGTYNDNGITTTDNTPIYIMSLVNQADGDDVTNNRPQVNLSNSIKPSQVHQLNRNYNSIHFDSVEVRGLVTSLTTTNATTILNIASTRCSMMVAVRGFSQVDGTSYFIDYILISRPRNNIVKIKSVVSDSSNYSGTNTYTFTADGNLQIARTVATGFWVTAKVVNMI